MSSMQTTAPGGVFELGGRPVARIGFGALQLSGRWYGPGDRVAPSPEDAVRVLRHAVELGINHIDTSDYYGNGMANQRIRQALAPYADDLVLVTKIGAAEDEHGQLNAAQRPEELRAAVESNLRNLGIERIDVVNLRRLDRPPGKIAQGDQVVDLDSQLAEMTALREEGKIGAIGISNVSIEQLRQALPVGIACVQNAYSMLDRGHEPLLELCASHGIAFVPFFALGSPMSQNGGVTAHPAVIAAASTLNATPTQVALAWLLQHSPNILLITGTTRVAHLEENIAAGALTLDGDTVKTLDAAAEQAMAG